MSDGTARDVSDAWNRFGQYMQAWGEYASRVAGRNQEFWAATSRRMSEGSYTADAAANDMLRLMALAQHNLEDLWSLGTRPVDTERYVKVLPTAFLFFDLRQEAQEHVLIDPVDIPVPPEVDREGLPERAEIALSGTSTRGSDDSEGVEKLTHRLHARLQPGGRSYRLETVADSGAQEPLPGVYDGLVYLTQPPLPLANLRIIVEGPPPSV